MGFLSGILGGGGGGAPATTNTQDTATTSGQGISSQGDKNTVGNNTTTNNVKTDSKVQVSSVKDSNNKITVANGGAVNYTTNTTGLSGSDLATFGNAISGLKSSGGTAAPGAGGGGVTIGNAIPPTAAANLVNASSIKWGLVALVGAGLAAVYFFFFRKQTA